MNEPLTFRRELDLVLKRWRLFAIVGGLAVLLSVVLTGPRFIAPLFRSQAVVYPMHISTYSIETTSDQLLQILLSNNIRDSVIKEFKLVEHYNVDTTRRGGRTLMTKIYDERVSMKKTRYESVDIQVVDEDPKRAQGMVLAIIHQANVLARDLQRIQSRELSDVIALDLGNIEHDMDSIDARMNELRRNEGILDYKAQAKEYSRGYMAALSGPGRSAGAELGKQMEALEQYGGEFLRLSRLMKGLHKDYVLKLGQKRQVELDLAKKLSYSNVVVYPEVADKKIYPIRWLVVLIATSAALLFTYILLALREHGPGRATAAQAE